MPKPFIYPLSCHALIPMITTTQTHMHKGVGIHTHIFVYIHTRRMCREEARMAEELSHVKTVTEGPESRL